MVLIIVGWSRGIGLSLAPFMYANKGKLELERRASFWSRGEKIKVQPGKRRPP